MGPNKITGIAQTDRMFPQLFHYEISHLFLNISMRNIQFCL
jgi:hypothetical protein